MEIQGNNIGETYGGGIDQLAHLQRMAEGHDAEVMADFAPQPGPEGEGAAEGPGEGSYNPAIEAECLLKVAREGLAPFYPCLRGVYTDETIRRIAEAAGPVMQKYGWTAGGFLETWGPEINLAAVVVPVGMATVAAIRAENAMLAAMAAARREAQPANVSKGAVEHGRTQGEAVELAAAE